MIARAVERARACLASTGRADGYAQIGDRSAAGHHHPASGPLILPIDLHADRSHDRRTRQGLRGAIRVVAPGDSLPDTGP
jgi:hypothetical protein